MTGAALFALALEALAAYRRFKAAGGRDEDQIPDSELDAAIAAIEAGDDALSEAIRRRREREQGQ